MKKLLIALLLLVSPVAMAAEPVEGVNYSIISMDAPQGEKIKVIEFFWYACPHCYAFEPAVKEWLKTKADDVEFVRYPATFARPNVQMHAMTFFALEQMGRADMHDVIMSAMHDRKMRINTQQAMDAFLSGQGIDLNIYRDAMNSFGVDQKMKEATEMAEKYQIQGVPSLVVDGVYKVEQTYTWAEKFQVADYLVARLRAERASAAK